MKVAIIGSRTIKKINNLAAYLPENVEAIVSGYIPTIRNSEQKKRGTCSNSRTYPPPVPPPGGERLKDEKSRFQMIPCSQSCSQASL